MTAFLVFLGLFAVIAALAILRGFVLSILWQWFALPLGLPEIGVAHAIGIALIVAMLAHQHSHEKQESDDPMASVLAGFLSTLLFLLVGWIIHFFM